MKDSRHPHPHIDPRQPQDGARPDTNPPVFAWKPREGDTSFRLVVARDADFSDVCLDCQDLAEPLHLPEAALPGGKYFWKWSAGGDESEVFSFAVGRDAVTLEVPLVDEWLKRLPTEHPRLYVSPDSVQSVRHVVCNGQPELWEEVQRLANQRLAEPHEIEEPPFLPDRAGDYEKWFATWAPIMWDSRRFVAGAETLALAHLLSGDEWYARAACSRLASISKWDPDGSSHIVHNDEAHMSVIWWGPTTCDWVWNHFTDEERTLVMDHLRRRGQITYEYMHGRGMYGISRFDSHAGREIVFLAMIALGFHEQIPEARDWLEWLRPVLCGVWPIWAGPDGGWAEGVSYGLAYVNIMTRFATALKAGTGIDLYQRPFWRGHAEWRRWCYPPYAEWIGFGDHTERWKRGWEANADLVDIIARQTSSPEFLDYVTDFRREAEACEEPPDRHVALINPQRCLVPTLASEGEPSESEQVLTVFPGAGWAAIRTALREPKQDVAFIFRSSPYGAISHSHANNNDFIIHVAGKVMAMPSGYYCGYGSGHHAHWVWHTKSHNCLTLSGAPQLLRSHDSRGAIVNPYEDGRIAYLCGDADPSYSDRAKRCRRHVIFLKRHSCFVLIDEFVALPGSSSAVEWNIHSWNPFEVDAEGSCFQLQRDGSSLEGHFLFHHDAFFSCTEGWDPPPMATKSRAQWHQQYHLRFTPSSLCSRLNLGVVLCPRHAELERAEIETRRDGDAEIAVIGADTVVVNQRDEIEYDGRRSNGVALLAVQGRWYEVTDEGVQIRT